MMYEVNLFPFIPLGCFVEMKVSLPPLPSSPLVSRSAALVCVERGGSAAASPPPPSLSALPFARQQPHTTNHTQRKEGRKENTLHLYTSS